MRQVKFGYWADFIVVTQHPGLEAGKAYRSLGRFGTEVMRFVAEV